MFKASELVSFCKSMLGMPYWYGTCVYKCTSGTLANKTKQYPSHYGSARTAKYKSDISKKLVCADCVGLVKGFFWTNGGKTVKEAIGTDNKITSKYGANGCPDKSAGGMLNWCKSKGAKNGSISSLPDVPGILLFSPGHVGVYIGGGEAIEARGFKYGIVQTKVASRSWTTWAYMPSAILEYDTVNQNHHEEATGEPSEDVPNDLGSRVLSKGCEGEDVKVLQEKLAALGYDLGTCATDKNGVDGSYDSKTVNAVKCFQKDHGLTANGQYDEKTHAKLLTIDTNSEKAFKIRVATWSVNVRDKPSMTNGRVKRVVRMNKTLTAVGIDEKTGWYKLGDGCYISNKYTCKV